MYLKIVTNLRNKFEKTTKLKVNKFEFNKPLAEYAEEGDTALFVHLNLEGSEGFINADVNINDFVKIGNSYYYGKQLGGPSLENLHSIDFGFYNLNTQKNSAEYTLDFQKYKK